MNQFSIQLLPSVVLFTLLCFAGSCSDDEPDGDSIVLGDIDPALVGTWQGNINGTLGPADLIMILDADGTLTAEGSRSVYCPFSGRWGVIGTEFNALGNDSCAGTFVTFSASVSADSLIGRWSASSGNSGNFSVGRQ